MRLRHRLGFRVGFIPKLSTASSTIRLPTQLRDARLQRADMRGADLAQAVLDGVDWTGSRRSGASFDGASMQNMRDDAST